MENSPLELSEELNALSYKSIGFAIEVQRTLGLDLLESAYQACLIYELQKVGIKVEKETSLPIIY
jgi:GxxExxY protein